MERSINKPNRKKFLYWGAALVSAISLSKYFPGIKNKAVLEPGKATTVKMLDQDGRLVEIDRKLLASSGKKISNEELQNWVTKKTN